MQYCMSKKLPIKQGKIKLEKKQSDLKAFFRWELTKKGSATNNIRKVKNQTLKKSCIVN